MTDLAKLKSITIDIISILADAIKPIDSVAPFMSPSITVTQDDNPTLIGLESVIAAWKKARAGWPGFTHEVKDMVAEGNKVWVCAEFTCPPQDGMGEIKRESVGMFSFDEDGKCVRIKNLQRTKGSVS